MHDNQYSIDLISAMAERTIKRLWITIILLLVLLFGSNAAWIYYESQWVEESVVQEVDTGNGADYVAGIGDVNYGEGASDGQEENP